MLVRKADGSLEEFNQQKIINTCLRAGVTEDEAEKIAGEVSKKIYDGIPTNRVLKLVLSYLDRYDKTASAIYGLRSAIARLCTEGYVFEKFIQKLLEEYGYSTIHGTIVSGSCVGHEVDVIAEKENQKILVECKHHVDYHTYTGLHVGLEVWAMFDDIHSKSSEYSNVMIVCNTKFSEHCIQYAECKKLFLLGWKHSSFKEIPQLELAIEEKKLYPVTMLTKAGKNEIKSLYNNNIITLKDLLKQNSIELSKTTGIKKWTSDSLINEASSIMR